MKKETEKKNYNKKAEEVAKKVKIEKIEKELWGRLHELNFEFAAINNIKKQKKKTKNVCRQFFVNVCNC